MKKHILSFVALMASMLATAQNTVSLTLAEGGQKSFVTTDVKSIDIDGNKATVNQENSSTPYNITKISFKKITSQVVITKSSGWLESAFAEWLPFDGAETYNVYIKGGQYNDYAKIDYQLVRNYGDYGRADVVGLQAGTYSIKVIPVIGDKEVESAAAETAPLTVKNYNRNGFAHKTWTSGIGAYNNDGTLKNGARVLYVTANTAKTVKASVITSAKGAVTECTGLQAIIDAYQKGYDTTPLAVRLIGMIHADNMDSFSSSAEGLQIKGKNADSELNITIEGIGEDATIYGFGFLCRNARSVEMRNFAIMLCMDDGISLDTDNSNIWIHHIDVFYGKNKGGDQKKGDGAIDVKTNSKYVTIDNCHFWDTGKSSMCGMKSESGPNYITYHHNWFDHSDSRHARIRTMSVHMYNNYFDEVAKYGVGAVMGASVFVENNYFKGTKKPILISQQGTDAKGSGTFSGENGGMIKAYGNYFDRTVKNFSYYTQKNPYSTGYDAYETETREEQVPSTEIAKVGGTSYDNFDTNESLMYEYTVDTAEDVPGEVTGFYGAGRLNHGDFTYTFKDNVGNDDTDSAIDTALETKIKDYQSKLIGIFGESDINSGGSGGEEQGGGEIGGGTGGETGGETNPDGTITCSFDKSGTPSNSFFIVSGNGSNSKGSATVDGTTYSTCLKMESTTSIKFTLTQKMIMTLYFGDTETASIKVDGNKRTGTGSPYTETLDAGEHELTKNASVNLFFIKLVPAE
ncbi:MAG: pectate lyase [Prevotella sp.]|nr:pectate lyase [Prevotella sp.]